MAIDGSALLIEGPSGSGKSALALALIDRGAALVSDDMVQLNDDGTGLMASPAPNIEGKLEIRNLGIVEIPARAAFVSLLITLDQAAPRFLEQPTERDFFGISIPAVCLYPDLAVLPLRAEWAMRVFGKKTA